MHVSYNECKCNESNLKNFGNSPPVASNFKSFSQSLQQLFSHCRPEQFLKQNTIPNSKPWLRNQSNCFYFFPFQVWTPPKSMNMCFWKKLWVLDPPISTIILHSCPLAPNSVWWACKRCHFRSETSGNMKQNLS